MYHLKNDSKQTIFKTAFDFSNHQYLTGFAGNNVVKDTLKDFNDF